ncbi:MAG: hypothetical protein ACQEWV_26500 [Bacillota bacterium]
MKRKKVLSIFGVFVLMILIVESGYFWFYQREPNTTANTNTHDEHSSIQDKKHEEAHASDDMPKALPFKNTHSSD